MTRRAVSQLLAPIVLERARVLAPAVLVALAFFVVAAEPLGIRPPLAAYVFSVAMIGVLAALTVAIVKRRIPVRWIHLASTATIWCPMAATLVSLYSTHNELFVMMLVLQIACAGVLLHTGWLVVTLVTLDALAIPAVVIDGGPYVAMFVSTLIAATLFALLIHRLMRHALVHAESHREAEAKSANQLTNQLTELERLQAQLLHAQRMEAVGTLAAGLAHDMNNVLGSITSFAGLLLEDTTKPEIRADLGQIVAQAERGAALTRGLLAFSRRGQYRKQVVRLDDVVRDVLKLLERMLPKSIAIRTELALGGACVEGDPLHLGQALVNLAVNAADAMDGKGTLVITGEVVGTAPGLPSGLFAQLRVTDTGKGMDAATRLRAFEPFFTTKPLGRGTGLGLSTVWGIVQSHGGAIEVASELGCGSTFTVHLPTTAVEPRPKAPRQATGPIARRHTVLIVDDEPAIRASTKRLLERMGLDVIAAENGAEGLKLFSPAVDLVILDMGMPVMGGAELFAKIRERSGVPVLIATGYAIDVEAQALIASGARIIEKPFPAADLRHEVTRMLTT